MICALSQSACMPVFASVHCRRKKARDSGISDDAIEEANDAGESAEQKAAFIALLLGA